MRCRIWPCFSCCKPVMALSVGLDSTEMVSLQHFTPDRNESGFMAKIVKDVVVRCRSFILKIWIGKSRWPSHRPPKFVEVQRMFWNVVVPWRITMIFALAQWGVLDSCWFVLARSCLLQFVGPGTVSLLQSSLHGYWQLSEPQTNFRCLLN